MIKPKIEAIKADLQQVLYLDLDDFRLDIHEDVVSSRFIGLKLLSAFQPIFDTRLTEGLIGYEAFLRPSTGIEAVTPGFAFSMAENEGKLVKLDRVARTLHVLNYLALPEKRGLLFLNVHPKLLNSVTTHGKVFEHILHQHSVPTREVVIEINESQADREDLLIEAINNYRVRGYRIAIDHFGGPNSNLDKLWQLSPHFVKLDIHIIQKAQQDAKLRRCLPKLIELIHALGAETIIQGIENQLQLDIALDAGAKLLQGYHLGNPGPARDWHRQHLSHAGTAIMPEIPFHFGSFSVPALFGL